MDKIKTKVLITGARGMLGGALCKELSSKYDVVEFDQEECDIKEKNQLISKVTQINPQIIIHAAAFTDVDGCELEPEKAFDLNVTATETIALVSKRIGALLVYISTDYVFDGKKKTPYLEEDKTNPISVYGKTKLEGEEAVKTIAKKYLIIRSSWLFGEGKSNFVNTTIKNAKENNELRIVNDKFASPTYAVDLAKSVKILLQIEDNKKQVSEVYHITNSGFCSWYKYAQRILDCANINHVKLLPINLDELNLKAPRPKFSVLDNSRYQKITGELLKPWEEAVSDYIKRSNLCQTS